MEGWLSEGRSDEKQGRRTARINRTSSVRGGERKMVEDGRVDQAADPHVCDKNTLWRLLGSCDCACTCTHTHTPTEY